MGYNGIIKKYGKRGALEGMINGLKRYIESTPENPIILAGKRYFFKGTNAPEELLKQMGSVKLKKVN